MSVSQKYLKDESGNVFSPITALSSIYNSSGKSLDEILIYRVSGYRDCSWKTSYTLTFDKTTALVIVAWDNSTAVYFVYWDSIRMNHWEVSKNITSTKDTITVTYSGQKMKIDLSNTGIVTVFQFSSARINKMAI